MIDITAECHSDDRVVECRFDARSWFEKADAEDVLKLALCGWSGDYPADEVAMAAAGWNSGVKRMFDYIEFYNESHKEHIGFECQVCSEEAMVWLEKNRPVIYGKVLSMMLDNIKAGGIDDIGYKVGTEARFIEWLRMIREDLPLLLGYDSELDRLIDRALRGDDG